jgi:hypothetical protein
VVLYRFILLLACGVCSILFITPSAAAQSQGILSFEEDSLDLTLRPPGDEMCDLDTGRIIERNEQANFDEGAKVDEGTAERTVLVRYSGSERALHNLKFETNVEAQEIALVTLFNPFQSLFTDTDSLTGRACSQPTSIQPSDVRRFLVLVEVEQPS